MPAISLQRSGFTRVPELFYSIMTDLLANGFTLSFPLTPPVVPVPGTDYGVFKATLEAGPTVDPLSTSQPWRLQLDATAVQQGSVYIATPLQLPNDGKVAVNESAQGQTALPLGMLNATGAIPQGGGSQTDSSDVYFVYRTHRITDKPTADAYPMSYRLSITPRGIALFIWEDASDVNGLRHQWFVVQRPVDRLTGAAMITGHAPLFAVFGMKAKPMKFVVREADVLKPTMPVAADVDTEDSRAILNSKNQVAMTENNRYVVTYPNGLNTPRYVYTDEIDLVAFTSSDVVSAFTDVSTTSYGEATPRVYAAMQANGAYNTGMRILMLKSGGGIP